MNSRLARRLAVAALTPLVCLAAGCTSPAAGVSAGVSVTPWSDPALAGQGAPPTGVVAGIRRRPTVLPAPLPGVVAPTCTNAPTGWLASELARPGVVDVMAPTFAAAERQRAVFGYLDRTYASCGEEIGMHLSGSTPLDATVVAIRVGTYPGGHHGRVVWTSDPIHVDHGPATPTAGRMSEIDQWPTRLVIRPTSAWPPGTYVLKVTTVGGPAAYTYVPLRILSSGTRSPYLAIGSDLTQLAYNPWGGRSLYVGPGSGATRASDRAYVASTSRPTDGGALRQYFVMDLPLAMFADRHRITLDWTTDMSLDADPSQVTGRATLVLPGHSEYWTTRTYDALEVAQDRGTNLMVLGGNEVYWHARVTRDAQGALSTMTVVRNAAIDVSAAPLDKTVRWAQAPLSRDQARVTGLTTKAIGVRSDGTLVSAPTWLVAGTGLRVGATLQRMFGNEADGPEVPPGNSPANLQVILEAHAVDGRHRVEHVTSAYFSAARGAGVFNAGTTEWLCATSDVCGDGPRPTATGSALDRITVNVFVAFATAHAGLTHPSHAASPGQD